MRIFGGVDELREAAGTRVGTSDWMTLEPTRIEQFADVTDDHQWTNVAAETATDDRLSAGVAHGFLILSLLPALVEQVYRVEDVRRAVNYGLNRVRFTTPVPVGARIRGVVDLAEVTDVGEGGGAVQLRTIVTVELEGSGRPAVVADWLTRHYR